MDSAAEEIKRKIDIVDFVGSRVALKPSGRNFKANCPFHNENTPSFMVSPERQIWRCFGACQDGGDVISFLMKWDNLTFYEALRELAEQAGVKLDSTKVEDREWKQKDALISINALATKYFHYLLTNHASGEAARNYVKERGLNEKLIKTFQLGYAPQSWDALLKFLTKKGYSERDIEAAGLAIRSATNPKKVFDRFRGRLMFPIIDARGNTVGFSGRLLTKEKKQAKYINTPETALYKKRETLYGLHASQDHIRTQKVAIVTEGVFDMISCYMHGLPNAVAIMGSAFTKDQLMLLKRYTKHLILALDADFSGTQTTLRAIKDAEDMDFRLDVVSSDLGKDPDEAFAANAPAYKKLIKKPTPIYDFILQTALSRHAASDAYEKKEIVNDVIPFIREIGNPIVKSHYIKQLAEMIDADTRDIEAALRTSEFKEKFKSRHVPEQKDSKSDRLESLQRYVLSFIVQHDNPLAVHERAAGILKPEDFSLPSLREIFAALGTYKGATFDVNVFSQSLSEPLRHVLDELFLRDVTAESSQDESTDKSFKKTLYELKKRSLRHILKEHLHNSDKTVNAQEIMASLAQVEKELAIL